MSESVIIKGRLVGPTRVELLQPVGDVEVDVEVLVHPTTPTSRPSSPNLAQFLESLPIGNRTKEEVDAQIREERDSWERKDLIR